MHVVGESQNRGWCPAGLIVAALCRTARAAAQPDRAPFSHYLPRPQHFRFPIRLRDYLIIGGRLPASRPSGDNLGLL